MKNSQYMTNNLEFVVVEYVLLLRESQTANSAFVWLLRFKSDISFTMNGRWPRHSRSS